MRAGARALVALTSGPLALGALALPANLRSRLPVHAPDKGRFAGGGAQTGGELTDERRRCISGEQVSTTQAAFRHPLGSLPVTARDELLDAINTKAVVHGHVTLSSGREASYYVDLRRITLDGEAAPLVGEVMRQSTAHLRYDAVGGLTLGADPVATAMLHAAARAGQCLNAFVVRKAGKEHGLQRRIEGPDVGGRRVLAVEDTSTTGSSVLTAVDVLKQGGAQVVGVAVVVDRGARDAVEAAGMSYTAVFEASDLQVD